MLPDDSIALLSPVLLAGPTAWHPDYQRVVDYARECRQFATGQVAELLRPYWRSETDEEFAKLLQVYVSTCESTWREISTPFYQVARLRDGQVERKLTYDEGLSEGERQRRIAAVEAALTRFYNERPLQDYLAEHIAPTVAMTDPNAWLLTEFGAFDYRTQQAKPYPVLLPCSAVIHFTRTAGTITSMTARYALELDDNTAVYDLNALMPGITTFLGGYQQATYRYTTYLPDYAVDYWPVVKGSLATIPGGPTQATGVVMSGNSIIYHYQVYEHGAGRVPASPIGYVPDQGAVGHVYWSPLHAALSWLKQELKTGHELQIVMRNMAMPRQLQYVAACTGIAADGGCVSGQCTSPQTGNPNDLTCRKCGGSGKSQISASSRQVIEVPLSPDPTENKLRLTDMLAFVGPDASIPDFQLKYQDWISDKCKQKLFGTTLLSKTSVTQTATERLSQLDQLAIALSPFADQFSYLYIHHGLIAASFVDAGQGLSIIYDFPEDLQLKRLEDLYAQLELAIKAGVRSDEVESIQNAIARKRHASDPEALRRYFIRSRFIPFLGLPDSMVIQLGALSWVTQEDVVMRFNSDRIFTDIEAAQPRFYDFNYEEQGKLVQGQINVIKAKLPQPASTGGAFRTLNLQPQQPQAVAA